MQTDTRGFMMKKQLFYGWKIFSTQSKLTKLKAHTAKLEKEIADKKDIVQNCTSNLKAKDEEIEQQAAKIAQFEEESQKMETDLILYKKEVSMQKP